METIVGQKRSRDESSEVVSDMQHPLGKKPCEDETAAGLALSEGSCVSSVKVVDDGVSNVEVKMAETLRSLEEELGVSDDQQTEFLMPVATMTEITEPGIVSNWSDVIWNEEGIGGVNEVVLGGSVECISESDPVLSEGLSSVVDDENIVTNFTPSVPQRSEKFNPVDIGFLIEASDDELGIPPSPVSDKEQSSDQEKEPGFFDNTFDNLPQQDQTATLHDAVSWALEGGADNMGLSETGLDDWMMGNLDFMMDGQSSFSSVLPLVEAGVAL